MIEDTINLRGAIQSWNRRQIFAGGAALGMALLALPTGWPPSKEVREILAQVLRETFTDLRSARAAGRAHLAADPTAEESLTRLQHALTSAARGGADAVWWEIETARERDWRSGDIAIVGGWVLARTEADLCVLTLTN
jgi:hypothetical protein